MSNSIVDDVLVARYYQEGETCFEDVCRRVANYIGDDDAERETYYKLMSDKKFLPNSPTLMNAGTDNPMLSACFVLLPTDSMESIFDTIKNAALIHKAGGGTGFTFGHLRPEGDEVFGTGGVASGPISFMKVFNAATDAVKQGSKRRGANMGVLPVWHPDIEKFISCKEEEGVLSNFNISVMIDDAFMRAVKDDGYYDLRFNGKIYKTINAKPLFEKLADHTWKNGEPGVIFYDTINRDIKDGDEKIEATNPCCREGTYVRTPNGDRLVETIKVGDEITTVGGSGIVDNIEIHDNIDCYRVCFDTGDYVDVTASHQLMVSDGFRCVKDLTVGKRAYTISIHGSLWLSLITDIQYIGKYKVYDLHEPTTDTWITNNIVSRGCGEQPLLSNESCNLGSIDVSKFVRGTEFDWDSFYTTVKIATGFLNNVIDKNKYPLPEIEEKTKESRKIGLGIMGFHDALIKMGIPYESDDALTFASGLMNGMTNHSHYESSQNRWNNKATTCIAPTGSIATLAGCSYGIEPIFSLVHMRYTWASGEKVGYKQIHPMFEHDLHMLFDDDEDKFQTVIDHAFEKGTIQDIEWLPKEFRDKYKTSLDISWQHHIAMQAAFQKYCDAGISKTINMPSSATIQDVADAIMMAWKSGCKGTTIYRSGSRENEVLELKRDEQLPNDEKCENTYMTEFDCDVAPHRPKDLPGRTFKMQSGCGKLWVTVNYHENRPYEVFVSTGGTGGCKAMADALGRMISLALRNELPVEDVIKQLRRVKCDVAMKCVGGDGKSCADIVAKCIGEVMSDLETTPAQTNATMTMTESGSDYCIRGPTYTGEQLASWLLSKEEANPKAVCPECGDPIMLIEGCITCPSCGWSKCK